MQLDAEPPGLEPRGIVHEVIGIIPAAGREPHGARDGETPVRRLIVLILEPAKDIAETRHPTSRPRGETPGALTKAWISSVVAGRVPGTPSGATPPGTAGLKPTVAVRVSRVAFTSIFWCQ